jgi:hypothetical protein
MRKIFVLLLLLWAAHDTSAQLIHKDIEQRYLSLPDQSLQFEVCTDDLRVKPATHLVYYWVSSGKLHHSKGDFHGELLHGNFTSFFNSHQLKSKGKFRKGLKTDVWKTWYENGELKSIADWKNGVQHGERKTFDEEGTLTEIKQYRNGRLHGDQLTFDNDSMASSEEFRKGKLVPVETSTDTLSSELQLLEIITPDETETTPEPPKEKWFKRILPKRKKKEKKKKEVIEETDDAKVEEETGA